MVNDSHDNDLAFESRTQKKHYAHSMVDLAHKLAEMKHSIMIELPMSEQIVDALVASRKIKSHIARKRHFQYIGKLLLKSYHQDIIDALDDQEKKHEAGLIRQPFLTLWTQNVLDNPDVIDVLYQSHEHSDIQTLRQLVRSTIKNPEQLKKNTRKVFEYLRTLDETNSLPNV